MPSSLQPLGRQHTRASLSVKNNHFAEFILLWWHQPWKCHFVNFSLSSLGIWPPISKSALAPSSTELHKQPLIGLWPVFSRPAPVFMPLGLSRQLHGDLALFSSGPVAALPNTPGYTANHEDSCLVLWWAQSQCMNHSLMANSAGAQHHLPVYLL